MTVEDGARYNKLGPFIPHLIILAALSAGVFIYFFILVPVFGIPGPEHMIILHDVKLYAFNVSTPTSTLTSNLQITIFCRNTGEKYGIHFDKINVYASYWSQQITPPTTIPPAYLGKRDALLWSPHLNGTAVPMNPDLAASLSQDVTAGTVLINVKATAQLRYKGWPYGVRYRMEVNCPANVMFGNYVVKDPFVEGCHTLVHR